MKLYGQKYVFVDKNVSTRAVIDAFKKILAKNEIAKRSKRSSRGLRPGGPGVRLMAPGGSRGGEALRSQRASAHLASQERPFHGGKMTVKRSKIFDKIVLNKMSKIHCKYHCIL